MYYFEENSQLVVWNGAQEPEFLNMLSDDPHGCTEDGFKCLLHTIDK